MKAGRSPTCRSRKFIQPVEGRILCAHFGGQIFSAAKLEENKERRMKSRRWEI